jgi:hypothetical protein
MLNFCYAERVHEVIKFSCRESLISYSSAQGLYKHLDNVLFFAGGYQRVANATSGAAARMHSKNTRTTREAFDRALFGSTVQCG